MSSGTTNYTTTSQSGPIRTETGTYKSWSGGDGKYDALGNPKWNAYTMVSYQKVRQENRDSGFILDCFYDTPFVFDSDPNLELRALSGLSSQIKGFDFNALVAYGERAQTIKLVTDSVKSLVTSVKRVRRGDLLGAVKALGYSGEVPKRHKFRSTDVAGRFLEIQYGWLPLLNDVYGSMDAYHKLTRGPRLKVFKSNSSTNQVDIIPYTKGDSRQVRNVRVVYYAKLSEPPSTARQLGLLDPATLAWELLPFSFVADWFIPIGPYLEATNIIESLNGTFLKTTVKKGTMVETGISYWSGLKSSAQTAIMQREILTSIEVPFPTFKPLDKALSASHVTNATALLVSIFGGGPRVK